MSTPTKRNQRARVLAVNATRNKNNLSRNLTRNKRVPQKSETTAVADDRYLVFTLVFEESMQTCTAIVKRDDAWFADEFDAVFKSSFASLSENESEREKELLVCAIHLLWGLVPPESESPMHLAGSGNSILREMAMETRKTSLIAETLIEAPFNDGGHHGPQKAAGDFRCKILYFC
jgi:hypothetical protein